MTIRLTDAMSHRKVDLAPLDPANMRMYLCGPTVYDRAHVGNARGVVVFDVLFRLLRHTYGADHVTYVRNITDVDDKINDRARATGRPIRDITDETIGWYREDMAALGALTPTHEPRATDYVPQMIAMIGTLVARGHAYAAAGHVLFDVRSDPGYGQLSGRSVDDMIAGARVEVAPFKRDPLDFVLWKPSDPEQPGWDSPWGRGRPGWHIECSAMSEALLGRSFDIHGGGTDLAFPHHENERAQSLCAHPEYVLRAGLAAQRDAAGRGAQDVQEPRQLLHGAGSAGPWGAGGGDPAGVPRDALQEAAGLDRGEGGAGRRRPCGNGTGCRLATGPRALCNR